MTDITTGVSNALSAVGTVIESTWDWITGNPLLITFVGLGIVAIGVTFFSRLKSV